MKLTIAQLFAATSALEALAAEKFKPEIGLQIARIGEKLASERALADKQRIALCEEHGTVNEKTNQYEFADRASFQAFEDAWAEVAKLEITVHIDLLPIQAIQHKEFTPATMQGLAPILLMKKAEAAKPEAAKPELVSKKKKAG